MKSIMQELHEKLRDLIARSGYTIYGFAQQSGIKRSTLQRVLLGNMKLSKKTLQMLLPHLQLSAVEREELCALQMMQAIGVKAYRRKEAFRNFLVTLSDVSAQCDTSQNITAVRFYAGQCGIAPETKVGG